MNRTLAILAALWCATILGCEQPHESTEVIEKKDPLPRNWNPSDLARAATPEGYTSTEVRVLIWQIKEDDRPLRVESAIICLRLEGKGNRWALAHVSRHPQVEQPPPAWRLSHVTDVKYTAL